jgi:hypothetical protein
VRAARWLLRELHVQQPWTWRSIGELGRAALRYALTEIGCVFAVVRHVVALVGFFVTHVRNPVAQVRHSLALVSGAGAFASSGG